MEKIELYQIFKLSVESKQQNLVSYSATFTQNGKKVVVPAFKVSDGECLIHFMPESLGVWEYQVKIDDNELSGAFECVQNTSSNHGSVKANGTQFIYADGNKYIPIGTTCYAWTNQPTEMQEQTVETLKNAPFNKIRMGAFPKDMPYNKNEPDYFPFLKDESDNWDVNQLDYRFWDNFELRISQLNDLGIEVDFILFHPYDRWGFSRLSQEDSKKYLEYVIARFAAYKNIWWSLANEYEMLFTKSMEDWDEYGRLIQEKDPYHHLTSIHNILRLYPKKDWMTHCSIQTKYINHIPVWKDEYQLPIVIDECGYEGNLEFNWGNLSAQEMVHRFWWSMMRGGYCTHGETFHREDEVLWWAKGNVLYGKSVERIQFLKEIMYSLPGKGDYIHNPVGQDPNLDKDDQNAVIFQSKFQGILDTLPDWHINYLISEAPMIMAGEDYKLQYFGHECISKLSLHLPENGLYKVEIIDAWNMTISELPELQKGKVRLDLPGEEFTAVLVTRVEGANLI